MGDPNAKPPEHTKWKPGQSGNPKGKPKGTKHLSTHIQDMLNDEEFDTYLNHPTKGYIEFKGKPIKAIITVAIRKATSGDASAMEWLAKHGYGDKLNIEVTDTRKDILSRYGLLSEGEDAGQTPEA